MNISVIIPLYNEDESLPELYSWIARVMKENNYSYEVIFVNDGSTDNSWKVISDLSAQHPEVKGIRFRRNYGKSPALYCGFAEAEGDVVIRSKNIILETMDYEVADSKKKEKALTADSTIKIRSKNINVSTANSKDVEVDENGKITKATYTAEGDIMVNSKNFTVAAIDWEVNNGEQKEKTLTLDGSFTVRTEKNDISATDTEGKATGKVSINAKAVDVKAVDVEKSSRADKDAAQGGGLNLTAETVMVIGKTEEVKFQQIHEMGDEVKIEAPVEITKELKTPKGTIDKLDVGQKFKSPNISDGM
jgi:hypothetical protein